MGVINICCTKDLIIQSSSISIYSQTEEETLENNDKYKDIISSSINDINQALKFITSDEYYPLLLKKIPKHIISKKICQNLNNNDIITLLNNLVDWIQNENAYNCDQNSKKDINLIKENTKNGLKYILKELKDKKLNNQKIDAYILQALTSISLIVQCILYIINKNKGTKEFNISIWGAGNIVDEAKKYVFQAAYFLLLTKKKYNNENKNINNENKITNDKKDEINNYYRISIQFTKDIIDS